MIPNIKKILYTTDLSPNARFAFSYAVSLGNRYDAAITILHVLEDVSPSADSLVINIVGKAKWDELRQNNENDVLDTIKSRLTKFCDDVSAEIPSCPFITDEIMVKIGNPVEEIVQLAEKDDYDVIVMGAHGQGIFANAVIGSTSRRVVRRCKKPVLVVRLPEEDED